MKTFILLFSFIESKVGPLLSQLGIIVHFESFSCLVPVYGGDKPEWLNECLNSVCLLSSKKPDELVIVLDGPVSIEIENIVNRYSNIFGGKCKILRNQVNKGLAFVLNQGLLACSYELVARIDADDIVLENRFEAQVEYFNQNSNVDILGGQCDIIDACGNIIGSKHVPIDNNNIRDIIWSCPLIHPTVMYKKSKILSIGGYKEDLRRRQDYELWFRCAQNGMEIANLKDSLIKYRLVQSAKKKNGLQYNFKQSMIGYKGCQAMGYGLLPRIYVFYPLISSLTPQFLNRALRNLYHYLDPRKEKENA
ncbi:glycosyltransferase [Vibrio paracholerae]|uniref:glycosyltransferase n=1 Tax=Vibrio paracholerae TaxID=650003 RepID=UPI00205024CD|nr:glycosyltransferase [Vibrio paracholerae]BCN20088.1 putative glycosyltransferase [Vibrio cholerae]MCO7012852.1 glycosyltransferase [Vibrio paracholerae]MCO7034151.1 glycosyltransferase [Vibrio paracholerae]MCO7047351.1 glycosyltransferase [Vibrio paracholerae]GHZ26487.1 putative glycosyltransferase [Vibrio cholerae]